MALNTFRLLCLVVFVRLVLRIFAPWRGRLILSQKKNNYLPCANLQTKIQT